MYNCAICFCFLLFTSYSAPLSCLSRLTCPFHFCFSYDNSFIHVTISLCQKTSDGNLCFTINTVLISERYYRTNQLSLYIPPCKKHIVCRNNLHFTSTALLWLCEINLKRKWSDFIFFHSVEWVTLTPKIHSNQHVTDKGDNLYAHDLG